MFLRTLFSKLFRRKPVEKFYVPKMVTAKKCGHTFFLDKEMLMPVSSGEIKVTWRGDSQDIDWCLECTGKAAILCAWCQQLIMPGDLITLNRAPQGFVLPEGACEHNPENRKYLQERPIVIGCTRQSCSCGLDICSVWQMPGEVRLIQSPLEKLMSQKDPMLIIPDMSQYRG